MKKVNKRKGMKSITVLLFAVTTLVWVALVFVKGLIWGINGEDLVNDIVSNILGILPPMIVFNFLYEYLTKDHMAEDMAEQITNTLIGKPEVLSNFAREQQVTLVKSAVEAIVGEESSEMVNAVVMPYLTESYDIRRFFKYSITLRDYVDNPIFPADKYMKVYENLKYKKTYIKSEVPDGVVHISFLSKNHELDKALRNRTYIFQENLSIDNAELDKLVKLSPNDRLLFVKNEMKISVYVDGAMVEIAKADFSDSGIDVELHVGQTALSNEHSVEISFAMPQRKGHSEFFVSINQPTFSPVIQLSYPESAMKVKVFSFLNGGNETSVETASHSVGCYEFCVQDRWIYPMSGVVFIIDDCESSKPNCLKDDEQSSLCV